MWLWDGDWIDLLLWAGSREERAGSMWGRAWYLFTGEEDSRADL